MAQVIQKVEEAQRTLGRPPWNPDVTASDDFLDPLFARFYAALELPNLMRKTDYHLLAEHLPPEAIDPEVCEVLDLIVAVAQQARPREG